MLSFENVSLLITSLRQHRKKVMKILKRKMRRRKRRKTKHRNRLNLLSLRMMAVIVKVKVIRPMIVMLPPPRGSAHTRTRQRRPQNPIA